MDYEEWNNIIAQHLFNPSHKGHDIFLYITKNQIIGLGKKYLQLNNDEEIWDDFIKSLKHHNSPWTRDPIEIALELYNKWRLSNKKGYPPYIAYLVLFTLPLIDSVEDNLNVNNYYGRVNKYFKQHGILLNDKNKITTSNFKLIDPLWDDLVLWSIDIKDGNYGIFRLGYFNNLNWIYVGKPTSQILIPPNILTNIPNFFFNSGLIPNSDYSRDDIRKLILNKGNSYFKFPRYLNDLLNDHKNDDLAKVVIEIFYEQYKKWTGDENQIIIKDGSEKSIRLETVIPLKLQFKINEDGEIIFSYRIKFPSESEPPEDLKLGPYDTLYNGSIWSNSISHKYEESFELVDVENKWIARYESKDIRLLVRGGKYNLGNDYLIETDQLTKMDELYLFCKSSLKKSIVEWGQNKCEMFTECSDYLNIPTDYSLFRLKNPRESHKYYYILNVSNDKKIVVRDGTGLRIGPRTYLNELLPEIEVVNADGNENIYLQYDISGKKVGLKKHPSVNGVWLLPIDINTQSKFTIQIENEVLNGYKLSYSIQESSHRELSNSIFPKRNSYDVITDDNEEYIQGNNIQSSKTQIEKVDEQYLFSHIKSNINQVKYDFKDSILLKWLVGIKECDLKTYYDAYDTIQNKIRLDDKGDYIKRRSSSIYLLDYLGYVDYDYTNNKIRTLPPKIISIPSKQGRRTHIIGGRDEKMINEMIKYCSGAKKNMISISIKKQNSINQQAILPDSIYIESNFREELISISNEFNIEWDEFYILKLKCFMPKLLEYEQYIMNRGISEPWDRFNIPKKVFNKESLRFESKEQIDLEYSLVEYKPSYLFEYGLFINQLYYSVDKNWGKYLYINYKSEKMRGYGAGNSFSKSNEIFYHANILAIPASLPLPKLYSRIILQISGEIPEFKQLNIKGKNVWYNIYRNVPSLFTQNFFRFSLNMNIERMVNLL